MDAKDRIYIDGAWVPSASSDTIDVVDSATEEVIATVPAGAAADVDRAVAAAKTIVTRISYTQILHTLDHPDFAASLTDLQNEAVTDSGKLTELLSWMSFQSFGPACD